MRPLPKISEERIGFSDRLKATLEAVHNLSPSPTVVAREFNFRFVGKPITVHAARKWLVGEAIPTQDKLRALAQWLDVSVEWLRFGGDQGASQPPTLAGPAGNSSPQDNLVRMFLALPHRERMLAQDFIEMLGEKNRALRSEKKSATESVNHS